MNTIKNKIWELKKEITYNEWGKLDVDWGNEYKLKYTVFSYFFRYNNYNEGLKNEHILKSTFGRKSIIEIKQEIEWWYRECIGAYSDIELQ